MLFGVIHLWGPTELAMAGFIFLNSLLTRTRPRVYLFTPADWSISQTAAALVAAIYKMQSALVMHQAVPQDADAG